MGRSIEPRHPEKQADLRYSVIAFRDAVFALFLALFGGCCFFVVFFWGGSKYDIACVRVVRY